MIPSKSALLSSSSEEARRLQRARERVQRGDRLEAGFIRAVILDSWMRSRAAGVDPEWGGARPPIPCPIGRAEDETDRRLVRLAAPVFDFMREALSVHPHLLMLTGRDARPLAMSGGGISAREGERINAAAGGVWREDRVGTDAVALCHAIGEPVQVHWYEHFALIADPWTGNSCPIRDPESREMLGTMNLYAYGCISHPQAFELTRDAAGAIERQLGTDAARRHMRALQAYADHLARAPEDAVLCLSRGGRILGLSSSARRMLAVDAKPVAQHALSEFVDGVEWTQVVDAPRSMELRRGDRILRADLQPIRDGREVVGYQLHVRRPRDPAMKRVVSAGAWTSRWRFEDIIGSSATLESALESARDAARNDLGVLLHGESGTGKELFAHAIHAAGSRASGPLVCLNCGGLGGELLAAELFGYEDGAFTGASRGGRPGKLEIADGGTLFLDEVEAMTPAMQAQLLRFLEDRRCLRVGGLEPRIVDVRIVAATNLDLLELVRKRSFRADLYYRLAMWPIAVPPLRDRLDDLPALAQHLLREAGIVRGLSAEAMATLRAYRWPGNVRELRNVLLQAGLRATGDIIERGDLSIAEGGVPRRPDPIPEHALLEAEEEAIRLVLERHQGRIGDAACALGMHRATLYRKLKRHRDRRRT